MLCNVAKYMYRSDYFAPPRRASINLEKLVGENTALVVRPVGKNNVLSVRVHPWPSWLTRGSPKVVDFFL